MVARRRDSSSVRKPGAQVLADLAGDFGDACAMSSSSLPYCCSNLAAVLGPTLSMPGMLSEVSPTSAR